MSTTALRWRLTVYLGYADIHRHRSVSAEILSRAHRAGLQGVTTLHGIEGFGHSRTIHDPPKWSVVERTPMTVHIIDTEQQIREFLPRLADLADQCLIVIDPVQVVSFGTPD